MTFCLTLVLARVMLPSYGTTVLSACLRAGKQVPHQPVCISFILIVVKRMRHPAQNHNKVPLPCSSALHSTQVELHRPVSCTQIRISSLKMPKSPINLNDGVQTKRSQ